MNPIDTRDEVSRPAELSLDQREAVLEEVRRILADPAFNGSKRCVQLFTYLVNRALAGDHTEFKERTLGIEVFGRDPRYDSQTDPIVRVTANEIRKRLGQCYYEEQDSRHQVKIRLARGGYILEFDFVDPHHTVANEAEPPEEAESSEAGEAPEAAEPPVEPYSSLILPGAEILQPEKAQPFARLLSKRLWPLWLMITIAAVIAGAALYHYGPARSRQDLFWAPLLHLQHPVMVCIADNPSLEDLSGQDRVQTIRDVNATGEPPANSNAASFTPATPFVEVTAANQIANWFIAHGRDVFLQRVSTASIHEFREAPVVFVGSFDNPWALMLTSNLRYHMQLDPSTHEKWIEDAQNPSKRDWKIRAGLNFDDTFIDYAVISRFWDTDTASWIVTINSLGPHGSRAAAELITHDSFANSLPSSINPKSNFQIVLKTSVVQGTSSSPQILAVYTW